MQNKGLLFTVAVGVLAAVVGWFLVDSGKGESEFQQTELLSLSPTKVDLNQVEQITLSTASNATAANAQRILQHWQLPNKSGFPVEIDALGDVLKSLQVARVSERKTSKPENFHRLGLRDISESDSEATLLTLVAGEQKLGLLLGNKASSGQGQYVRFAGQNQTYLIDTRIQAVTSDIDWLREDIFELSYEQVQSVTVETPDGSEFTIERAADTAEAQAATQQQETEQQETLPLSVEEPAPLKDFQFTSRDENEQLQYSSILNGLVRNILGLKAKDVRLSAQSQGFVQQAAFELVVKLGDMAESGDVVEFTVLTDPNAEEKSYWLSQPDNLWLIQISEFDFKQISKARDEYLQNDAE